MSWANPSTPNLADFTLFVQNSMGISTTYLPSDSPFIGYAFNKALALVLNVPCNVGIEYTLAVYNCGGHILLWIAPDQAGYDFFVGQRKMYGFFTFQAGVVQSSSDQATATTLAVTDALAQLTIGDLQFTKTPWGQQYLAYAMDFGGIWGLT